MIVRCHILLPAFKVGGKVLVEGRPCGRLLTNPCSTCKAYDEHKDEWAAIFSEIASKRPALHGDICYDTMVLEGDERVRGAVAVSELTNDAVEHFWVHDPVAANKYAQTHARPPGAPPHWVRCDFVRNGVRCVKGSGHEHGVGKQAEHEEPKVGPHV